MRTLRETATVLGKVHAKNHAINILMIYNIFAKLSSNSSESSSKCSTALAATESMLLILHRIPEEQPTLIVRI